MSDIQHIKDKNTLDNKKVEKVETINYLRRSYVKLSVFALLLFSDVIYKITTSQGLLKIGILLLIPIFIIIYTMIIFNKSGFNMKEIGNNSAEKDKKTIYRINNTIKLVISFGLVFLLVYCLAISLIYSFKDVIIEAIISVITFIILMLK